AGRAGRLGVLLAAAGLVAALLARDTMVAVSGDQLVAAPLHGLLSMTLLALMIGAGAAFDALARRAPEDSRTRRVGTAALAAVVACVCLVTVVGWSVLLPEQLEVQRSTSGQVPAAAADQGRTEARTRVLVLETDTDDGVRASLVVHGGESIIQQSAAAELRDVQTVRSGTAVDEDPGSVALRAARRPLRAAPRRGPGCWVWRSTPTAGSARAWSCTEGSRSSSSRLPPSCGTSRRCAPVPRWTRIPARSPCGRRWRPCSPETPG